MRDRELMQHVLETMQHARVFIASREKIKQPEGSDLYDAAIDLLRARLSAPEPEPVAFKIYKQTSPRLGIPDVKIDALPWVYDQDPSSGVVASMWVVPANSAPPQREWQGLTDKEINKEQHLIDWTNVHTYAKFARAIEAKLKEKNNGI